MAPRTAVAFALAATACGEPPKAPSTADQAAAFAWTLPPGFPEPRVPADNPMTDAKVELGRHLFYETRLSVTGTDACGTCHQPALAFTDGLATATAAGGVPHRRASLSLVNVAYRSSLTWANPLLADLETQVLVPLFGDDPVEIGLTDREDEVLATLAADPVYAALFPAAFPEAEDPFETRSIVYALAAFQRTLLFGDSPIDRFLQGTADADTLSPAAREGLALFNSERLECYHCHGGFDFSDAVDHAGLSSPATPFHNTGLYNLDGAGAYPLRDQGLIEITAVPADMGAFRAPGLRFIGRTAPYMHDGTVTDLDAVIDHYAAGGRTLADGPDAGNGSESPLKSPFLIGFTLTPPEREALLAFFAALDEPGALDEPRFADPWAD